MKLFRYINGKGKRWHMSKTEENIKDVKYYKSQLTLVLSNNTFKIFNIKCFQSLRKTINIKSKIGSFRRNFANGVSAKY